MDNSENEDDPKYESEAESANDKAEKQIASRRSTRRISLRNKKVITLPVSSSDSENEVHKVRKSRGNKKQKVQTKRNKAPLLVQKAKDYTTGSFLILKSDAKVGDPNKPPCIWRVDGKALLQKYEPFDDCGQLKYRTTSVYTGWSVLEKDLYAPIAASIVDRKGQTLIVDFKLDKLKEIDMDSD